MITQKTVCEAIQTTFPELKYWEEIPTKDLVDISTWTAAVEKTEKAICSRREENNIPLPMKKEYVTSSGYEMSSVDIVIPSIKTIIDFRAKGQHNIRFMLDNAKVEALRQSGWDVVVAWDIPEISKYMVYSPRDRKNRDFLKKIREKLKK